MKNWKWEIEDDYAGPAHGAWLWIAAGIAVWTMIIWICWNTH
jgi:hypothetical protein